MIQRLEHIKNIQSLDALNFESALVLYDEMKLGVIEVSSMSDECATSMKSFVYKHGNTGDILRLRVETYRNGTPSGVSVVESVFVKDGTFVETSFLNNNLFLPFEGAEDLPTESCRGECSEFYGDIQGPGYQECVGRRSRCLSWSAVFCWR